MIVDKNEVDNVVVNIDMPSCEPFLTGLEQWRSFGIVSSDRLANVHNRVSCVSSIVLETGA